MVALSLLASAVFVAASYGNVVLLDGSGQALRSFGRGEQPAASRDGRIAFVRGGDVWTVRVDGSRLRRVTRTAAREESPDWSPDGRLVWSDGHALVVDGRRLTRPASWQEDRAPAWSPDGRTIAFASSRAGAGNQELYLVRADGSGLRRLTTAAGDDGMPSWRPDGRGLVFVSNRDGNLELYELALATGATRRLTETPQDETLPRVGPGGRYVFVSYGKRIVVANAALGGRRVIQAGTGVDWLSPSG